MQLTEDGIIADYSTMLRFGNTRYLAQSWKLLLLTLMAFTKDTTTLPRTDVITIATSIMYSKLCGDQWQKSFLVLSQIG